MAAASASLDAQFAGKVCLVTGATQGIAAGNG